MNSIIQSEKKCYITGDTNNLHSHHIFGGANRKLSEKYGLKVWLRADWHNMSNYGVHFNRELDLQLKKTAQLCWEEKFGSRQDFRRIFGKSWLDME